MIRFPIVALLLILHGLPQSEEPVRERIELWATGSMHEDEVVGKTGEKWFALCRTANGFELRMTRVAVLDSQSAGGLYDKFIKIDQPSEVIFLVRGITGLKEGPVKTVYSGHQFVKPSESISLQLSSDLRSSYQLYAEGKEGKETIDNYRIILYNNQRRQTIFKRTKVYLEGSPSLLWAGDLDRDGKLDLLMDMTDHYNASEPTLLLSSRVASNELVKRVASYRRIGC